jgi:hypothetical protein
MMDTVAFSAMSVSAGTLALLCVSLLWVANGRPAQPVLVQLMQMQEVLIQLMQMRTMTVSGSVFDVLHTEKVAEREAGQLIRRAARIGYKDVMHMYDQVGSVYIVFQLCPQRVLKGA